MYQFEVVDENSSSRHFMSQIQGFMLEIYHFRAKFVGSDPTMENLSIWLICFFTFSNIYLQIQMNILIISLDGYRQYRLTGTVGIRSQRLSCHRLFSPLAQLFLFVFIQFYLRYRTFVTGDIFLPLRTVASKCYSCTE